MWLCYYRKLSVTIIESHQVIMKWKFNSENQKCFGGIRVAYVFSFLCCPIMRLYVLSPVLWYTLRLCCVFALFSFVFYDLCCQFLWIVHYLIAPSVFSNFYIHQYQNNEQITSHFKSLSMKRSRHRTLKIQVLTWDRHKMWRGSIN